jgi:hypothetical protein
MNKFTLRCRGPGTNEGKWLFEPVKDGMSVFDPDDRKVCWFPHAGAGDRFTLPSFWRSIKYISFRLPDGSVIDFEPESRAVAKVKEYLEDAIAFQGIDAVHRLRKRGWSIMLGGVGMILFGVLLFGLLKWLEVQNRTPAYGAAVMLVGGIGNLAWGISAVSQARRVQRRLHMS